MASNDVITNGRDWGMQPAITQLMATFSTVASPRFGGTWAITSSGARAVDVGEHLLDPLLGWRDYGQAVAPAPRVVEPVDSLEGVGHSDPIRLERNICHIVLLDLV